MLLPLKKQSGTLQIFRSCLLENPQDARAELLVYIYGHPRFTYCFPNMLIELSVLV